jgi:hypothetical protein
VNAFWIEVKGEWREEILPTGPRKNPSYSKYIVKTAEDLDKLATLTPQDASHVGLLALGFDRLDVPIHASDFAPITARMTQPGWQSEYVELPDSWWNGYRIRCWFWWRAVP